MALRETITIRPYAAGDEVAIVEAWNRVRATERSVAGPLTVEEWRAIHADHPLPPRILLGCDESGEILAQCAGLPLRARVDGRAVFFCLALDGFLLRSARTGHARRGLFTACSEAFREAFGGAGEGRHVFVFGAARRHGAARLPLGLSFLREAFLHVLPLADAPHGGDYRVEVREVERFGPEATEVYERVAVESRADLVRDALYLNARHGPRSEHPTHRAIAVLGSRPAGVAVWRRGLFGEKPAALVQEWLVPRDEPQAAEALHGWLAQGARAEGAEAIAAELSPFAREWTEFQSRGFRVARAAHTWHGASHLRGHALRFFARHLRPSLADGVGS